MNEKAKNSLHFIFQPVKGIKKNHMFEFHFQFYERKKK